MKWSDAKITIIGMGFLMEYIFPCFRKAMGENVHTQINAVTADEGDLQGKRDRMGIDVYLNDNAAALRAMRPDYILFAPPPSVAPMLTETCLVPYYAECRERGEALPTLLAFPPSPKGVYYMDQLGQDIKVVNIIPNMISSVGDEKVPNESSHLITYPEKDNWTQADKEALNELLTPMGRCLNVPPKFILHVLSAEIATHPLTELADIAARSLNQLGIECTYFDTASSLRACHQQKHHYTAPGTNHCAVDAVKHPAAVELMSRISEAWYNGLHSYLTEVGFGAEGATALLDPLFDLYYHEAQLESRETIVAKARKDATPGGMLELCMESYFAVVESRIAELFTEDLNPDEAKVQEIGRLMAEITGAVVERGSGLTAVKMPEFGPKQHAVMFGLLAKGICDHFGEEADALLWDAVAAYGSERGQRMAKRCVKNGDPLDMASYVAYGEWSFSGGFEKTQPDPDCAYLNYKVVKCPWCTAWLDNDLADYGTYYCRCVDKSILRGFNPELKLSMPTWLSHPDYDCCHFNWESAPNTQARIDRIKEISARLGGEQVRDFQYHTAHEYQTILRCAYARDAEKAAKVEADARRGFAKKCSHQELLRVLAAARQDFLAI